jgi:GNAT superfamily N-acetyltransferase
LSPAALAPGGTLQVLPAQGPEDVEAFIRFPFGLHRLEKHWVPPLLLERQEFLDPRKNPVYEYAKVQLFLARRGSEVVGTIAAVRNDRYGQYHPEEAHVGFFGLYECVADQSVADALFAAACAWLKGEGLTVARGPVNLTTNDVVGLLVEGFDLDNAVMMPYNPPYYAHQFVAAGFTKTKDLYAYYLGREEEASRRLEPIAARLARDGHVKVRPLDLGRWKQELAFVRATYNVAWKDNWGFVPWTDREMAFIAKELKPLVDPRFAFVGEVDGVPAGFIVSVPDANEALKLAKGKLLPTGLLKILWKLKVSGCTGLRTMIMGVLPEYRRRGLDLLMIHHTVVNSRKTSYLGAELSWVLEDNRALLSPLEQLGARRTKTYRVYDRPI